LVRIAIVDYGVGNLKSIRNGLRKVGAEAFVTGSVEGLKDVDAVVLPGVGAFGEAIRNLADMSGVLRSLVDAGRPLLGICLGLQLLFTASTEGGFHRGLGFFRGLIVKLPSRVKIPHIGWNTLEILNPGCVLLEDIPDGSYVYFVHSYYAKVEEGVNVDAETVYGVRFPSVVSKEPVFATQFHPERSGKVGLRVLENFVDYVRR